jgi:hypothetical protein
MESTFDHKLYRKRKGERGAALWTSLIASMLVLGAGSALILTTSMSATNSVDSIAESQAYYAAECGLQESLNVLRGNVASPTFTFSTAADTTGGHVSGDTTTYSRLSKWLPYGNTSGYPDRVTLTSPYSSLNGLAFSVRLSNPDPETTAQPGEAPKTDSFVKPNPPVLQPTPAWHQWHCGHCSWDYSHHPYCTHKHCTNPQGTGRATVDDTRLVVQSTGYGPKGAVKQMEMMVKHTPFDYDNCAATVLLVGNSSSAMTLKISQDKDKAYSGDDLFSGSTTLINAIGLTTSNDKTAADTLIGTLHNAGAPVLTANGTKTILLDGSNTPVWLQSADDARTLLSELQANAVNMGRYYTTSSPPAAGTYGDDTHALFTFVDGDFTIPDGKKGGGLLVVTGTLTFAGTAQWYGLVLCLGNSPSGTAANVKVTLNKNAVMKGALVIAAFDRTQAIGTGAPFLAPSFDNQNGGDTIFQYNSGEVRDAIYTLPPRVVGVHEGLTVAPPS